MAIWLQRSALSRKTVLDTSRASAWYRIQSGLAAQTATQLVNLWDGIDPDAISQSWQARLPAAVEVTASQSLTASSGASRYVAATVADAGADPVAARIVTSKLVDRDVIERQLWVPMLRSLYRISQGQSATDALLVGRTLTATIGAQTTRDTAREAVEIAMVTEPRVDGYVRYLVAPSCGRCAVLAGRVYPWSSGFARHPNCDCQHRPIVNNERPEARSAVEGTPDGYFNSLSKPDQEKYFGSDVAEKIREGESISQAVNADRGMWRANYPASRTVGDLPRPIVSAVMARAKGDRAKAVQMLADYGLVNESGKRITFAAKRGTRLRPDVPRA